jgi:hypothetical protein
MGALLAAIGEDDVRPGACKPFRCRPADPRAAASDDNVASLRGFAWEFL